MDPASSDYLHNIAELAITFAATSALLTIVRQIRGGRLSKIDVYLLTTFTAAGFTTSICAVLPGLVGLMGLSGDRIWAVASILSAALLAIVVGLVLHKRKELMANRAAPLVRLCFAAYWLSVCLLVANALLPGLTSAGIYAAAITLSLGTSMLLFVRRLSTLGARDSHGDWDL